MAFLKYLHFILMFFLFIEDFFYILYMSNVLENVRKIVAEQLGVNPDDVNENSSFINDLGADSLDTVELVMSFEEEFKIEIPDEEAEKIKTVGDAVKYIENNIQ